MITRNPVQVPHLRRFFTLRPTLTLEALSSFMQGPPCRVAGIERIGPRCELVAVIDDKYASFPATVVDVVLSQTRTAGDQNSDFVVTPLSRS